TVGKQARRHRREKQYAGTHLFRPIPFRLLCPRRFGFAILVSGASRASRKKSRTVRENSRRRLKWEFFHARWLWYECGFIQERRGAPLERHSRGRRSSRHRKSVRPGARTDWHREDHLCA